MKNLPLLIVTIIGTIALVIGVAVMFSNSSQPEETMALDAVEVMGQNRPSKGPEDAKVVIVEFADFQCPACLAAKPLIDQQATQYPNDVKIVYRHFPLLQLHPYALLAAQAAEAAYQEGKFWEMYDKIFTNQTTWEKAPNAQAARDIFIGYAEELGIDKARFTERIDSSSVKDAINADVSYATQIGVNSTPTIFVNGVQVPASQLPQLSQLVQSLVTSE